MLTSSAKNAVLNLAKEAHAQDEITPWTAIGLSLDSLYLHDPEAHKEIQAAIKEHGVDAVITDIEGEW